MQADEGVAAFDQAPADAHDVARQQWPQSSCGAIRATVGTNVTDGSFTDGSLRKLAVSLTSGLAFRPGLSVPMADAAHVRICPCARLVSV
jgi:hypothetical protein